MLCNKLFLLRVYQHSRWAPLFYKFFFSQYSSSDTVAPWIARLPIIQKVEGSSPSLADFFLSRFVFYLTGRDYSNLQNIIRFVLGRSELVENDTSLAYIGQFWFWQHFWAKNAKNRTQFSIKPEVTDRFC